MNKAEQVSLIAIPVVIFVSIGLAFAGSQGGATFAGMPVFAIGVALAFIINWVAFIPAYLNQTEKFFDLMGGITFISVIVVSVILSPTKDGRSWLLLGMVVVWALRLSLFLYQRVHAAGEDRRFRELKPSIPQFLLTWTLQGIWVSFSLAEALVAITSKTRLDLGVFALVGFLVWAFGFGFEVVSDSQKSESPRPQPGASKTTSTALVIFLLSCGTQCNS